MNIYDYFPEIKVNHVKYDPKTGFRFDISKALYLRDLPEFDVVEFRTANITLRDKYIIISKKSSSFSKNIILTGCGYTVKVKANSDFRYALKLLLKKISVVAPYVTSLF